jgi:hypothetical protein
LSEIQTKSGQKRKSPLASGKFSDTVWKIPPTSRANKKQSFWNESWFYKWQREDNWRNQGSAA